MGQKLTQQAGLNNELYVMALKVLKNHPVMGVEDFEIALIDLCPELGEIKGKTGSGRLKWKNRVDWAKAELTQRGLIRYVEIGGVKHILYLESCGNIEGKGLVYVADVHKIVDALGKIAS